VIEARDASPRVVPSSTPPVAAPGVTAFCTRHFAALACVVLALTAFNLTFRLGHEFLTEWDESLYATTASEALDGGHWIGTTFQGALDYYNTKPPLNVWLIALSLKLFGNGLVALRLTSVLSAWLTVLVLLLWTRRVLGPAVALASGLVLATSFGFIHIHAGRSANTDALFTLLVLLTVVVLWAERERPWMRAWLGPILAATFLLRGMAVLMPLVIVAIVWVLARDKRARTWRPALVGLVLFALPVGAWMIARFRVDRWAFLDRLFFYDFVARTSTVIEDHPGGPLFYLNILQKHQFDWLIAGAAALLLAPIPWTRVRAFLARPRQSAVAVLFLAWTAVTLIEPTLMRTKLPWYLNSFYPAFAIGVGALVVRGLAERARLPRAWRVRALAMVCVLAFGVAEGKLIWYSFVYRDLALSDQSLVLAETTSLAGHRVYRDQSDRAGAFVTSRLAGAQVGYAASAESFLQDSAPGDYLVVAQSLSHPALELVRSSGRYRLYRHLRTRGMR
jgi:4-amino-4-deoxy-L-arabinose transferase-like glycosyltransferase